MYSTKDPSFKTLLRRNIYFPIAMMLLFLAVLAWLLNVTISQTRQVEFTLQRIASANNLMTLVVDSETGLRGYELTKDIRFLDPYLQTQTKLPLQLAQLQRELASDVGQVQRAKSFETDFKKWSDLSKPSRLSDDITTRVPRGLMMKLLVDSMRMRASQIIQFEQEKLKTYQEKQRISILLLLFVLGGGVLLVGGLLSYQSFRSITVLSERYEKSMEYVKQQSRELRAAKDELETRVEDRTRELKIANIELEAFSYSIAHDLRAPLRHIGAFAHIIDEECVDSLDDNAKEYLQKIFDSTAKMDQLISDLLQFSRLGRTELTKERIDLNQLVKTVIEDHSLDTKNRKVNWDIAPLPMVYADQAMLKQVLTNLLSNSIKYSSTRSIIKIKIGYQEDEKHSIVVVSDNGVGFNEQYIEKLFGVFQRLHNQQEFEGTGIGLANVKRIINRHGGEVWAESTVNKGATFYFSLPKWEKPIEKTSGKFVEISS